MKQRIFALTKRDLRVPLQWKFDPLSTRLKPSNNVIWYVANHIVAYESCYKAQKNTEALCAILFFDVAVHSEDWYLPNWLCVISHRNIQCTHHIYKDFYIANSQILQRERRGRKTIRKQDNVVIFK